MHTTIRLLKPGACAKSNAAELRMLDERSEGRVTTSPLVTISGSEEDIMIQLVLTPQQAAQLAAQISEELAELTALQT